MQKMNNDNLLELITEKYDNEISIYKLITLENAILENKMLYSYASKTIEDYFLISSSIKRTVKRLILPNYL